MLGEKFEISEIVNLTGLFHDMGKYSQEFVDYLRLCAKNRAKGEKPPSRGTVIHATQGAKYLYEMFSDTNDLILALLIEIAANCIVSHHGGLMDGISPEGETQLINRLISDKEKLHFEEVKNAFLKEKVLNNDINDSIGLCKKELIAFLNKCNEKKLDKAFMFHLLTKTAFSCLVDADRNNAYCYEADIDSSFRRDLPDWNEYAKRLEEEISKININSDIARIRQRVSSECYKAASLPLGVYCLNVPTGGGKTLSSLLFAINHAMIHNLDRIIYVIPYLSIIDQTVKDIKEALSYDETKEDFILEHHSNTSIPINENEAQTQRLFTDRWNKPIIVTTMVQFLESIYSHKSSDLRKFHNMANSIMIFDEIQALPIKCVHLFNEAVNYLHTFGNSTAILCTATQPPLNEVFKPILLTEPSNLITNTNELFYKLKRTHIKNCTKTAGYTISELCDFVIEKANISGNCLVILNTKDNVSKLYKAATDFLKNHPEIELNVVHLSTSMCPAHRLSVINALKTNKNNNRVLCISTQLIEAGVNLSFGCVIRAVAGLDSIAQAAGRCNRHGEDPDGRDVFIVNLAEENLSKLPDIKCGAGITYRILNEPYDDLLSPPIMERYYAEYFYKRKNEMDYPTKASGQLHDLLSVNCKGFGAYLNSGGKKPPALRQAFQTAGELFSVIEDRTTSVLVPYEHGIELIEKYRNASLKEKYRLLREIGLYSVSLYPYQLTKLKEVNAIHSIDDEILFLDVGYYDKQLGVIYEIDINNYFR